MNANRLYGAWESKEDYLRDQYRLLREDATRPLRDAVARLRRIPAEMESRTANQIGIYERVFVRGFTFTPRGIAVRIAFSTGRVEKRIRWEMSKRLLTGSIVALTPTKDAFQTTCIVAVVAARPLENLQLKPPELDLYLANPADLNVDAHQSYLMVEARRAFFEAHRHTMTALQHISTERFPFSKNLVFAEPKVGAPPYLNGDRRRMDFSAIFASPSISLLDDHSVLDLHQERDVLNDWPAADTEFYDLSQQAALHRILTKRLAVIQGPPGTGKTHVSVAALKVLLSNMCEGDPPILISCHTNHALDQILCKIAEFEPKYARLGGFSRNPYIKERSIVKLRGEVSSTKIAGDLRPSATKTMKRIEKELEEVLETLGPKHGVVDPVHFLEKRLMSQEQFDSLEKGAEGWASDDSPHSSFKMWLESSLCPAEGTKKFSNPFTRYFEDAETEIEAVREYEAENVTKDDDEAELLLGTYVCVAHKETGQKRLVASKQAKTCKDLSKEADLWNISPSYRGDLYCEWLEQYKQMISQSLQTAAASLSRAADQRRVARWERDLLILQKQRVIGMTTTGLSKYRPLVAALKPRIILVEEAGESLEGSITSACLPSTQQLILVGDHQQLKPRCHFELHGRKLNMNISLFERLINNKIEYSILTQQRRMRPEIRRLLYPIYGDILTDHPHVTVSSPSHLPPVAGMGGIDTFFFDYPNWIETKDADMSFVNHAEANMIASFVAYLLRSGEPPARLTVLTFYKGQRAEIDRLIRAERAQQQRHAGQPRVDVRSVDSYQGEENDVVVLALTRCGGRGIGFVRDVHRVCVALSRARRGLYIFGDAAVLRWQSEVWARVLAIMGGSAGKLGERPKALPCRVGRELPIGCPLHERRLWMSGMLKVFFCSLIMRDGLTCLVSIDPVHWMNVGDGACQSPCRKAARCGHPCQRSCHLVGECLCSRRC